MGVQLVQEQPQQQQQIYGAPAYGTQSQQMFHQSTAPQPQSSGKLGYATQGFGGESIGEE